MSSGPPVVLSSGPLLRLRPLSLGEILDDVFRVYRRQFLLLFTIALLVALPGLLVQFASGSATQFGFFLALLGNLGSLSSSGGPPPGVLAEPPGPPNFGVVALGYLVFLAVLPFAIAALPMATIDIVLGNRVTVGSTLRAVARRYWALVGIALLYLLLSPLVICLPVFIWLFVRWAVAVPAMLAEGVGPIRALDRSWVLTHNHWWRLFGILLLIYFLTVTVSGALGAFSFPLAVVVPFVPAIVRGGILLTAETVTGAVVQPALYLCLTLLYFDLRIRRESFDLDQLARQAVAARQ